MYLRECEHFNSLFMTENMYEKCDQMFSKLFFLGSIRALYQYIFSIFQYDLDFKILVTLLFEF